MKITPSQPKTKKYYKPYSEKDGYSNAKVFLVRYCKKDKEVFHHGPIYGEKGAMELLNTYLRKGTCAWIVSYNDT